MPPPELPPLVPSFDRDALLAAVSDEGWPFDLSAARRAEGWENVALVGEDWIVRFPRDETVRFAAELEILAAVDGRLPVPTPQVSYIGRRTRCMAYRRLTGFDWSREAYIAADEFARQALADSCAAALVAMHGLVDEISTDVPDVGPTSGPDWLDELAPPLGRRVAAMVTELQERWPSPRTEDGVLLHNDFHLLNAVQRDPVGPLAGLWDFSCVATGPPEVDLRYLEGSLVGPWTEPIELDGVHPHDLLRRTAAAYARSTGIELDLRTAILANRLENLEDQGLDHVARSLQLWHEVDAAT